MRYHIHIPTKHHTREFWILSIDGFYFVETLNITHACSLLVPHKLSSYLYNQTVEILFL